MHPALWCYKKKCSPRGPAGLSLGHWPSRSSSAQVPEFGIHHHPQRRDVAQYACWRLQALCLLGGSAIQQVMEAEVLVNIRYVKLTGRTVQTGCWWWTGLVWPTLKDVIWCKGCLPDYILRLTRVLLISGAPSEHIYIISIFYKIIDLLIQSYLLHLN